jgi:hypothetical protein
MFTNVRLYLAIPGFSLKSPMCIKALKFLATSSYVPVTTSSRLKRPASKQIKSAINKFPRVERKLDSMSIEPYIPRAIHAVMNPENSDDEDPYPTIMDLSSRKTSIENYHRREMCEDEEKDEGGEFDYEPIIKLAGSTRTVVFDFLSAPSDIPFEDIIQEPITSGDLSAFHAARVLDVLIDDAMRSYDYRSLVQICRSNLTKGLDKIKSVGNATVTLDLVDFKLLVRQQVSDLIARCSDRMEQLGDSKQFDVRRRTKMLNGKTYYELESFDGVTKTLWLDFFKLVEEADFIDDLITRVPDVIVQRYMTSRVNRKIVGLDVNKRLLAALQIVRKLLSDGPLVNKGCSYPLM